MSIRGTIYRFVHFEPTSPIWWAFYALAAMGFTAILVAALPMWFRDDDAAFLNFVVHHPFWDAFVPGVGAVQGYFRPVTVAFWWLCFHVFGWTYWPYEATQLLLWFATLGAYYTMLRLMLGRRKPAIVATLLTPLVFYWLNYYPFRFSQVNFQLELLFGFLSVALAAEGWRRRRFWLVVVSWFALAAAYLSKEPSVVYLPILHIWCAARIGRHLRVGWAREIVAIVVVLAITLGEILLVRSHVLAWGAGEQAGSGGAFLRWTYYADLMRSGPTGVMLAILAGVAAAVQAMRLPRRRWPIIVMAAVTTAAVSLAIHPLVAAILLGVLVPLTRPFVLWAAVMQAALLFVGPMYAVYLLESSFAYPAIFLVAIWRSPATVWIRAFIERISVTERRTIYTGILLLGAIAAANMDHPVRQQLSALQTVSDRRLVAEKLAYSVVRLVPNGANLAVIAYEELGVSHQRVHAMPPNERAQFMPQFDAYLYGQLLEAMGRDDIRIVTPGTLGRTGGWLVVGSRFELEAAEQNFLLDLGLPRAKFFVHGHFGGLFKVAPARETSPSTQTAPGAGT